MVGGVLTEGKEFGSSGDPEFLGLGGHDFGGAEAWRGKVSALQDEGPAQRQAGLSRSVGGAKPVNAATWRT